MSAITFYYCDACATRIDSGRTLLKVECGSLRSRRQEIDLCPTCAQKFAATLREHPAAELPCDVAPVDDHPLFAGRSATPEDLAPSGGPRQ
jgi:hypothetical protein